MPTDDELIDGLRDGLAPLRPDPDLIDRLRERAASPRRSRRAGIRRPRGDLGARLGRPAGAVLSLAVLVVSVGVFAAAVLLVRHRSQSLAPQARPVVNAVILAGDGIGGVRFGASPKRLRELIDPVLGAPTGRFDDVPDECGIDGQLIWPIVLNPLTGHLDRAEELLLTFDHNRFVGYQFGGDFGPPSLTRAERLRLRASTAQGLMIGDTLAAGRQLYGSAFRTSAAQGGSWQLRTPQGELAGYTGVPAKHSVTSPSDVIATIDAGDVGCPAASP